ncbi:MAG: chemotaxis protein CheW [bacterium]|nr:chemotaxis protein CheW [bacterium]
MEGLEIVVFKLEEQSFGVDISQVKEILKGGQIEALSDLPSFLDGIVKFKEEYLPVIDLEKRLGAEVSPKRETSILVIDINGRDIGVQVTSIQGVGNLGLDGIRPIPRLILKNLKVDYIWGIGKLEKDLIFLLDLNRVLKKEEIAQLVNP